MTRPPNWPETWRFSPTSPRARAPRAMVATTDRYASEAGMEALARGGNAVDAAVAASFALAVVNPEAGNVGGGGFLVAHSPDGTCSALDFRSVAPAAATPGMYVEDGGVSERATLGAAAAAVPGSVAGLHEVHARLGRLPWRDLLEPAIELARGFLVTERHPRAYTPDVVRGLSRFEDSRRIFLPGGRAPLPGETFRQPELARTLERIRDHGREGFYAGETAALIEAEMERGGGLVTRDDLARYAPLWREPVVTMYRGHRLVTMPPPSSGGVVLALVSGMLEAHDLGALPWHGAAHVHLLAEAWRRAFADRNASLGDPAFVDAPVATLLSRDYARRRGSDISLVRATPSAQVGPGASGSDPGATTHLSVVDAEGGAVSLTTTINSWFGAKATVGGAGFLLNNDMDDFTARPGVPNQFGLVQGEANRIEPGKRMLSAMTPTLVLDAAGRLRLVVGSPGGAWILTTVFQVISSLLDHRMSLAAAVNAPRVHHQHLPDQIRYEAGGLPETVIRELREMGHEMVARDDPAGDVQAIAVRDDGTLEGMADPRRGGAAVGG